jgi:hypothetical protein
MIRFAVRRAVALGVGAAGAWAGHWLFAVVWFAVLGGLYWYSVRALRGVPCWLCGGSGTRGHRGLLAWLFGRAVGDCLRCHGAKVNQRWGTRLLGEGRWR